MSLDSNPNWEYDIVDQLINILNDYRGEKATFANQGQAMNGYSALAEFVSLAQKAKNFRITGK